MNRWMHKDMGDHVMVKPIADLKVHVRSADCWCHPRIEDKPEYSKPIVIHNSLDKRELHEGSNRHK